MMLRAKPARSAEIVMSYRGNAEPFAMAALSLLVWLGAFAWLRWPGFLGRFPGRARGLGPGMAKL